MGREIPKADGYFVVRANHEFGVYDGKDVELPFEWYYRKFSGITLLDDHDGNGIYDTCRDISGRYTICICIPFVV